MKKMMILGAAILMSASVFAQKIGYVNSQEAFFKYSKTKIVQKNLASQKNKFENQIKTKEIALQKDQVALQKKGKKVTKKEELDFQRKLQAYQKFIRDSETKLQKEQFTQMKAIENTMEKAIATVAKAGKYDYILEAGAVKYGGTNVTDKVIAEMNKTK